MHFIPLQKWYDIILCCHSSLRVQTLMVLWLWRRVIYDINLRVLVAMVTKLCTHFILQWYETHTMLCNGMKCIPVLILKSQRHTFSQTNNFSQINKFFVFFPEITETSSAHWDEMNFSCVLLFDNWCIDKFEALTVTSQECRGDFHHWYGKGLNWDPCICIITVTHLCVHLVTFNIIFLYIVISLLNVQFVY